jgi:tetraacyldisaccharide-1-P 4'-kinase
VYRRGVLAGVRTTIARWLEEGALASPATRFVGRAHEALSTRSIARPLRIPEALVTVTVGGSTLGGSGKTRVAVACARELAGHGAHVALIGHAYRARPGRARVVTSHDALDEVGDEALSCVRDLASSEGAGSVRVVVAPSRQAAVDFAARLVPRVDAVVLDGPLQLAPVRSSLAVLALDAAAPWGAGASPPAGDLKAPADVLLAHADRVVHVDSAPRAVRFGSPPRVVELAAFAASLANEGRRVGLFTALARPDRLVRALAAAGARPHEIVRAPDHGPLTRRLARRLVEADSRVDVWLATSKCAAHLDRAALGERLGILDGTLVLPSEVALVLRSLRAPAGPPVRLAPTCMP